MINIIGEIDAAAFKKFKVALSKADINHNVKVTLMSDGGDANVALAFFDLIRSSPKVVHITATGLVASAAVLILAAADHRCMTPSAWAMVHEESPDNVDNNNVSSLEKQAAHFRRIENQWSELLRITTKADTKTWAQLHKEETYLNPQQCLELGLIDLVLT